MSEGFVKKLYKTADIVKCIFACPVESVAPSSEIKCLLQSRFPPNFHMRPHMFHRLI